ncbi:MAG: tRNA (adenosine(37)-N6)-threonylcarbamoyltransferase complex dimerization subunit type 1 TsaB [Bacteroidota bacterium]
MILSIETATPICSLAIHNEGSVLCETNFFLNKSHSSVILPSLKQMVESVEVDLTELKAIAVSSGPGSYTGLRIGTSAAKGLAYSISVPLISVSTLHSMVLNAQDIIGHKGIFCPMMDARRMEVYHMIFKGHSITVGEVPKIISEEAFNEFISDEFYYFGDGADKCKSIFSGRNNMHYLGGIRPSAKWSGILAWDKYQKNNFEDLAYFEPDYLKEFQTKPSKKLL